MNTAAGSSVGSAHRIVPKRPFDSKPIRFTKTERLRLRAAGTNAPAPCQNHCAEVVVRAAIRSFGWMVVHALHRAWLAGGHSQRRVDHAGDHGNMGGYQKQADKRGMQLHAPMGGCPRARQPVQPSVWPAIDGDWNATVGNEHCVLPQSAPTQQAGASSFIAVTGEKALTTAIW